MTPRHRFLERVVMDPPMAVRVVDAVTSEPVADGLKVTAWSPLSPGEVVVSQPVTPSGHYLFPAYPALEFADDPIWATRPELRPFIQVEDNFGRYLPLRFQAAPVRALTTIPGSPLNRELPLYSSPSRAPLTGMGIVRANLLDTVTGFPGAWALLELTRNGVTARALADRSGSVHLPIPYPEAVQFALSSLSRGPMVALSNQRWSFTPTVRYRRWSSREEIPAVPDLEAIQAMAAGRLLADTARTPLTTVQLTYGQELVLKSLNAANREIPYLLVEP